MIIDHAGYIPVSSTACGARGENDVGSGLLWDFRVSLRDSLSALQSRVLGNVRAAGFSPLRLQGSKDFGESKDFAELEGSQISDIDR